MRWSLGGGDVDEVGGGGNIGGGGGCRCGETEESPILLVAAAD